MTNNLLLNIEFLLGLNGLKRVDIAFFSICGAIVVLIIAVYFLIPVFNKKQYKEQRDNLKKREEAFKSSRTPVAETDEQIESVDSECVVLDENVVEDGDHINLDCGFANLSDNSSDDKTIEAIEGLTEQVESTNDNSDK